MIERDGCEAVAHPVSPSEGSEATLTECIDNLRCVSISTGLSLYRPRKVSTDFYKKGVCTHSTRLASGRQTAYPAQDQAWNTVELGGKARVVYLKTPLASTSSL